MTIYFFIFLVGGTSDRILSRTVRTDTFLFLTLEWKGLVSIMEITCHYYFLKNIGLHRWSTYPCYFFTAFVFQGIFLFSQVIKFISIELFTTWFILMPVCSVVILSFSLSLYYLWISSFSSVYLVKDLFILWSFSDDQL